MKNRPNPEQILQAYELPISGLKNGVHQFEFDLEDHFFSAFENSLIYKGNVKSRVQLDKRNDLLEFELAFDGNIVTNCDRCLEEVELEVAFDEKLRVKKTDFEEDNPDVVFIPLESQTFNIGQYLFELIHVTLPMAVTHDLNGEDCPVDLETFLQPEAGGGNSLWDALKDVKVEE